MRFSFTQQQATVGKINSLRPNEHGDLNTSMTKDIIDIFLPVMPSDGSSVNHILIEGAPGMGKTVLAKEIAYRWAKNELLTSKKLLFLVFLRECHHTQLRTIEQLIQYIFVSSEMTTRLTEYLLHTEGKDAVIIFDGFDELSEESKKKCIIIDIINRRILAKSCLVITSRPTASSSLHGSVDRRVEIVGFTEEDRLDYIQAAFENRDEQVKAVQHYLQSNPTINALCYVPLNMTILLCLVEDGIDRLPKTQTEMYKKFIEMTIIRFIKQYRDSNNIISIARLPHPHDKLFVELATLAYEALKTDKIVFTFPEIIAGCPNLTMSSSNWNGLGLLKAVQCFSKEMGNDQVTFHFLHFSIQEYMAALYISNLSDSDQIKLLKETFWDHHYYNTWIMYVGLTGGKSFALRHFLSGNRFPIISKFFTTPKVCNKYLKHKLKCLHLFQCLVEAKKEGVVESVKQLFENKQIDLSNQTLLPNDLNTLGFFLIRSLNKEWDVLNLSNCNIGNNGSNILCDLFLDKDVRSIVTIKMVYLSYNQLNFSSIVRLFGLFNSWHTSEMIITDDIMFENTSDINTFENAVLQSNTLTVVAIGSYLFCKNVQTKRIIHVLSNTTNIRSIYMFYCTNRGSSEHEFLELLMLLKKQKLDKFHIISSSLDKVFIKAVASILLANNDSVNMFVYDPTMSDEIADDISSLISSSNKDISGVMLIVSGSKIQGIVNTCTLSNKLSKLELFNLSVFIKYLNIEICSWRENMEHHHDKNITVNTFVELLHKCSSNYQLKIALLEGDTLIVHKTKFSNLKFPTDAVSVIYLSDCDVTEYNSIIKICYVFENSQLTKAYLYEEVHQATGTAQFFTTLNSITTLNTIEIINFGITNEIANNLANILHCNIQLQELHLNGNNLQTGSAIRIAKALQVISTLRILSLYNNKITDEAADDIAAVITHNTNFQHLNVCKNYFKPLGTTRIAKSLHNIFTFTKLYISDNNITDEATESIVAVLSHNTQLQELNISGSALQTTRGDEIAKSLLNISTLTKFYFSNYSLTDEAINDIASAFCHNNKLEELDIHGNSLLASGAISIAKALQGIITLTKLCINDNNITYEAANDIAVVISNSIQLQEFDVGRNDFYEMGTVIIAKALQSISTLTILRMNDNNITCKVTDCIAAAISCNIYLQEFNIGGNKLGDTGAMNIARGLQCISTLTKLYIYDNNITYKVANDIAAAISCNTKLQEFDINTNDLQAVGAMKIAKALQGIDTLTKININDNNITFEAASDIAEAISKNIHLQEFDLGRNYFHEGTMIIAKALQSISTLTILCMNDNNITYKVTDYIAAAISHNIYLQEFNIGGNKLGDTGIVNIAGGLQCISTLTKLYIYDNNITYKAADDIAAAISCNTELQEFDINTNNLQAAGTMKIAKALQGIDTLTKININDNNITFEAANDIAVTISKNIHLQEFDLGRNDFQEKGTVIIAKALQNISELTKLYIHDNNITHSEANSFADDIAAVIMCNTQMEELDVSENDLHAMEIIKIAKSLQHICTLKKMCISKNNITDKAANDITDVIKCNPHLQEFDISVNSLQTRGVTRIAKSLQNISMLTKLHINNNNITDEAAYVIADIILCNSNLEEFYTGSNNLQTVGAMKIIKALQKISSLKTLYMGNNNITDVVANDIAAVISCNKIQELDVSDNNLKTTGAIKLARALQNISTLTNLYINNNNITDEAADDIAAAISCNAHLKKIDIGQNRIQGRGAIRLAKSLQQMSTLQKLFIDHNMITDEAVDDFVAVIHHNPQLNEFRINGNELQNVNVIKAACFANGIAEYYIY